MSIKRNYAGAMIALVVLLSGCGPNTAQETPAASVTPAAVAKERVITDLSQLSHANTAPLIVPHAGGIEPSAPANPDSNAVVQSNIDRFFVANAYKTRYSEDPTPPPGDTRLLNAKAEKYADFSYDLLRQTMTEVQKLEPDSLKRRKLPDGLRPMILTAVMDRVGRLTEISIEQHSGDAAFDKLVIDACKKGLWSRNPPVDAMENGAFRLRIEASINNYSFNRDDNYTYDTHLGLGIL